MCIYIKKFKTYEICVFILSLFTNKHDHGDIQRIEATKKITNQFEIILTGNLFPTKTGIQDKVKCKADTINQL